VQDTLSVFFFLQFSWCSDFFEEYWYWYLPFDFSSLYFPKISPWTLHMLVACRARQLWSLYDTYMLVYLITFLIKNMLFIWLEINHSLCCPVGIAYCKPKLLLLAHTHPHTHFARELATYAITDAPRTQFNCAILKCNLNIFYFCCRPVVFSSWNKFLATSSTRPSINSVTLALAQLLIM
jgi:hypothetical protein